MTPNGVAALAYRAREGLRQAYLEQYLPTVPRRGGCQAITVRLARWARNGFPARTTRRITGHLKLCPDCRELAADLQRINSELPAVIGPVVLGDHSLWPTCQRRQRPPCRPVRY